MAHNSDPAHARRVLIAEDNPDDFDLTRLAFEQVGSPMQLECVKDGAECLARLRREGPYARTALPDLLLLDINMPIVDGFQVMAEIARDERLRHLPVVIFTSSDVPEDVLAMHRLRCSSYIKKPVDFAQFVQIARFISAYWCGVVELPRRLH
ncbi:MAG TPA: response regulator [Burkholderiales bacterium]|nr:response regulator [Burkholderiales bacterium]